MKKQNKTKQTQFISQRGLFYSKIIFGIFFFFLVNKLMPRVGKTHDEHKKGGKNENKFVSRRKGNQKENSIQKCIFLIFYILVFL